MSHPPFFFNQSSITGGRYRFAVSFVEHLLKNGLESPHRLLSEFIKGYVTRLPGDTGEPFISDEPDLQILVKVHGFEWERLKSGKFVLQLPVPPFVMR